jgi:hypothetical protein
VWGAGPYPAGLWVGPPTHHIRRPTDPADRG